MLERGGDGTQGIQANPDGFSRDSPRPRWRSMGKSMSTWLNICAKPADGDPLIRSGSGTASRSASWPRPVEGHRLRIAEPVNLQEVEPMHSNSLVTSLLLRDLALAISVGRYQAVGTVGYQWLVGSGLAAFLE
jgi:hypothetical protein